MYLNVEPYHGIMQKFGELLQQPDFLFRLTGIEGSGKSSLLKQLCSLSKSKGFTTAFFPDCPQSPVELRKLIQQRFSLPKSHNFNRVLERQLLEGKESSIGVILFFDDCHLMSDETLLALATLTEVKVNTDRLLSIVFCGTPEFSIRLMQHPSLQSLLPRFTGTAELPLLDRSTLPLYIYRYFEVNEETPLEFEKPALDRIYKLSKGFPGIVTGFCQELAVLQGGLTTSTPVTKADIDTLVKNDTPDAGESWFMDKRMLLAGGAATFIVLLAVILGWQILREPPATPPVAVVTETVASPSAPTSVFVDPPVVQTPVETTAVETTALEAPVVPQEADTPEIIRAEQVLLETNTAEPGPVVAEPLTDEPDVESIEPAPDTPLLTSAIDEIAELTPATGVTDSVELAVIAWGDAWQNRDMDAYFASYHPEYLANGFPSQMAWRANRQRNIAGRDGIRIAITEFRILNEDIDQAEVNFWLHYESPGYSDDTLKMMNLVREGEQWLIMAETNLEVRQQ